MSDYAMPHLGPLRSHLICLRTKRKRGAYLYMSAFDAVIGHSHGMN